MKISVEIKNLLDKLYNLRGEDSVILAKMNKEREEAIETQERTKNEKAVLIDKIDSLTKDEETLTSEGEKLTKVLSSINRSDFANVLERLNIDFDPEGMNAKVSGMLPDTISKVALEKEKASKELEDVEAEMNNAITKVEELGIRKDEALSNQAKLNEYFDLALAGNINITRDEITGLLEKFDFTEDEKREAAKIMMFPEDGLYEYENSLKGKKEKSSKTITDVLVEAKKESQEEKVLEPEIIKEEVEEIKVEDAPVALENDLEDTSEIEVEPIKMEESILEDVFDKVLEENVGELKKLDEKSEKDKLIDLLESIGVNSSMFLEESIKKVLANYDEELIKTNVTTLREHKISLDILKENAELLYDKELAKKLEKLLDIGKEARDINLMPEVLVKYDLKGLTNTINVLQISGLDPKKVPLMAY